MKNYFEELLNKPFIYPYRDDTGKFKNLDSVYSEFNRTFFNKENLLPTEYKFNQFVFRKKKEISDVLERLTVYEKKIYFDKLKKEISVELGKKLVYRGSKIKSISPFADWQELTEKLKEKEKTIFLTEEQNKTHEEKFKFTLNSCFETVLYQLLNFIEELENQSVQLEQGKEILPEGTENLFPQDRTKAKLKKIWLKSAPITIDALLKKGIDAGTWDESMKLILKRGSIYGSGLSFLSNLCGALYKKQCLNEAVYTIKGKLFCEAFNLPCNRKKEPYKEFSKPNQKAVLEIEKILLNALLNS